MDLLGVVPAHYDAPLNIGPAQFAEAFDFIRRGRNEVRTCDEDVRWVRGIVNGIPPYCPGDARFFY